MKALTAVFKLLAEINCGLGQYRCSRHGHQKQAQCCHGDELKQPVKNEPITNKNARVERFSLNKAKQRCLSVRYPHTVTLQWEPPRRCRFSPLASEQMSESDWTTVANLNKEARPLKANQRTENPDEYFLQPMGADHAFAWYTPKGRMMRRGWITCKGKMQYQ